MMYMYNDFFSMASLVLSRFECEVFMNQAEQRDYYKIIWAKDEDVSIGIDGYRVLLMKDHFLFCTPLNVLDPNSDFDRTVAYLFNREFYCIRDHDKEVSCNGLLFFGSSVPVIVGLTKKELKSFELLYVFFEEEFGTKDHIQGEMLRVLLKRLLIMSVRIAKKNLPQSDMSQSKLDTIRKFNLLVEMHFREKHKVSDYADLLSVTPKSLSNLFSKYERKSPLKVIGDRIVLEAQRLLMFSDKPFTEISEELGFLEASHFSKFFKKHTGLPPKGYKEMFLQSRS